jgi:hypothetical protein
VRLACIRDAADELVQRRGDRLGAFGREQVVEAAELDKPERHRTVLALAGAVLVQVRRESDSSVQARRTGGRAGHLERSAARLRTDDEPLPLELGREIGGGADGPGLGAGLLFEDGCHEWAGDDELPVSPPCEVEMQPTGGDARGQGQRHGRPAHTPPTDRAHGLLHRHRRAARPFAMAITLEEDEHCIAPELEDVASELLRVTQDVSEDGVDRVGELLGADPATPGEPLAQLGETRDIGEQQRRVQLTPAQVRLGCEPPRMNGRQVGLLPEVSAWRPADGRHRRPVSRRRYCAHARREPA